MSVFNLGGFIKTDDVYFSQVYIIIVDVDFTQKYINTDKKVQIFQYGNRVIYYESLKEVFVLCKKRIIENA